MKRFAFLWTLFAIAGLAQSPKKELTFVWPSPFEVLIHEVTETAGQCDLFRLSKDFPLSERLLYTMHIAHHDWRVTMDPCGKVELSEGLTPETALALVLSEWKFSTFDSARRVNELLAQKECVIQEQAKLIQILRKAIQDVDKALNPKKATPIDRTQRKKA